MKEHSLTIDFGLDGSLDELPHSGWCSAEVGGRWTFGLFADLFVPAGISRTTSVSIEFEGHPFLHHGRPARQMDLQIGAADPASFTLDSSRTGRRQASSAWLNVGQWIRIRFAPHHPERPRDVLGTTDTRELGFFMISANITITPKPHIDLGRVHDTDYLAFTRLSRKNPVILDIGANVGQSISSFKEIFPQCTVHSFEVNPELFQSLARRASDFSGVTIHEFGLSDNTAEVDLRIPCVDGVVYDQEASVEPAHFETDPGTINRFAERGGIFNIRNARGSVRTGDDLRFAPDIIKIDVEGAEWRVVKGLQETIACFTPVLIIENGSTEQVDDILVGRLGYRPFQFDMASDSLSPRAGICLNTIYIHPKGKGACADLLSIARSR